jgi:hypothetical protein
MGNGQLLYSKTSVVREKRDMSSQFLLYRHRHDNHKREDMLEKIKTQNYTFISHLPSLLMPASDIIKGVLIIELNNLLMVDLWSLTPLSTLFFYFWRKSG